METMNGADLARRTAGAWATESPVATAEAFGESLAAEEVLALVRRARDELASAFGVAVADILALLGRQAEALAVLEDLDTVWVLDEPRLLPLTTTTPTSSATANELPGPSEPTVTLVREDECWTLGSGKQLLRLRSTRGLGQLALLIANPGVEIHALDLFAPAPALGVWAGSQVDHRGQPVLDDQAKREYRRRLETLEEEAVLATALGDDLRAIRADEERDALVDELRRASGLGGRDRRLGSDAERARVNVTRTLRAAVERIERLTPDVGSHLRCSLRTGTFCCYQPTVTYPRRG